MACLHSQFRHHAPHHPTACRDIVAAQTVRQLILLHQVVERLVGLGITFGPLLSHQGLGEWQEIDHTYGDHDQTHRQEREKRESLVAALDQRLVDDEVRRRTNEREHTAQTAGEGEGHEHPPATESGLCRHTDDDRHHQRHRTRVAYKGANHRGGEHDEQEGVRLIALGQAHHPLARLPRQSRLEDGATYDEEARHHDDYRGGEARQGFGGTEHARNHQYGEGGKRDHVATDAPPNKKGDRQTKNY